jgi:hypothetical protein
VIPVLFATSLLQSHLFNLVAFSSLVSAVFATLLRDDTPSRVRFGLRAFGGFVLAALLVSWVMRPFPS